MGKSKTKQTTTDEDNNKNDLNENIEHQLNRERWQHKADGIITLLGYSIGEGTVLKFPYMCARNGGGAFLLPFLVFTVLCALPVFYLELVIGQYFQSGTVKVWNLCPAMKGLGLGSAIVSLYYAVYTSTCFAWYCYYFVHSFSSVLPWSNCDNTWNTGRCIAERNNVSDVAYNVSHVIFNVTQNESFQNQKISEETFGAAEEFWRFNVLDISDGLHDMGKIRWPLVACLVFTYLLMYLILFKGIRISGKVVYVTFSFPILLITILLIRGALLPGATDGILYYMRPDFTKLENPKIWMEACGFALYSMATSTGCIITVSSRNKFSNNCFKDSLLLVFGDAFFTIYCGFAVFAVLGHLAWIQEVSLDHFESGGFNIAFMVFPEAVTYLPLPQLWAAIVFLMFMTLGLDSTVPSIDVLIAVIGDKFPRLTRRRWMIVAMVMLPMFLMALLYVTQGGIYLLIIVDWFCGVPTVIVFGTVQCLILGWVFGLQRLDKCTTEMYAEQLPAFMKVLIKYVTPALLVIIFGYALYGYRPPQYGDYVYPQWAAVIGWLMTVGVMLPMLGWIIYSVWKAEGATFKEKLKVAFEPNGVFDRLHKTETCSGEDMLLK